MRRAVLTYYSRSRTMLLYTQGRALLLPTDQSRESGKILWDRQKLGWRLDACWVNRSIFKWNLKTNKSAFRALETAGILGSRLCRVSDRDSCTLLRGKSLAR